MLYILTIFDRYTPEKEVYKAAVKDTLGYNFHFDLERVWSDIRWGLWQKGAVNFHSSTWTHGDPYQPSGRVAEMNPCSIFISRHRQLQAGVSPFCWWLWSELTQQPRGKPRGQKAEPQRDLPSHGILLQLETLGMKTKRLWQKSTGFRGLSVPQPEFAFPLFALKMWC